VGSGQDAIFIQLKYFHLERLDCRYLCFKRFKFYRLVKNAPAPGWGVFLCKPENEFHTAAFAEIFYVCEKGT
jgi:hypothetical protein